MAEFPLEPPMSKVVPLILLGYCNEHTLQCHFVVMQESLLTRLGRKMADFPLKPPMCKGSATVVTWVLLLTCVTLLFCDDAGGPC
jgi:hypothetical protein